jgi:hypothetical protein
VGPKERLFLCDSNELTLQFHLKSTLPLVICLIIGISSSGDRNRGRELQRAVQEAVLLRSLTNGFHLQSQFVLMKWENIEF